MTSRERMTLLLRRELPDRMGLYEHFWGETLGAEGWQREGYPEGANAFDFFGMDMEPAGGGLNAAPLKDFSETMAEDEETQTIKNGRGAILRVWKNKSGTPQHVGFTIDTPEKWREHAEPLRVLDRSRYDAETTVKELARVREAGRFAIWGCLIFIEILRGTLGDVTWMMAALDDPDWIRDVNQTNLDFFRTHYEAMFADCGKPDGMFLYDDAGFTNGLFVSPDTMRELILPYWKELVGFFHDHGLPVILHTCGGITKALPLIVEAGFDCLQPMEAKAGCNVVEYAQEYRDRLCFMGNMDVTVLNTNDRDKVRAEVVGKLWALKDLGAAYVFHSDHSIPPDVRYETYCYALELLAEEGKY